MSPSARRKVAHRGPARVVTLSVVGLGWEGSGWCGLVLKKKKLGGPSEVFWLVEAWEVCGLLASHVEKGPASRWGCVCALERGLTE